MTLPTPVLENVLIVPPEFVAALSCMMTLSTGLGHLLLTAGIGSIAE